MAKATNKEFCKDCKNYRGEYDCAASISKWTSEVTGKEHSVMSTCSNTRDTIVCNFQPKPTVWKRIKVVILG